MVRHGLKLDYSFKFSKGKIKLNYNSKYIHFFQNSKHVLYLHWLVQTQRHRIENIFWRSCLHSIGLQKIFRYIKIYSKIYFQVLVVHYENVKHDLLNQMRRILSYFHLPIDEDRLQCLLTHKDGLFHRYVTYSGSKSRGRVGFGDQHFGEVPLGFSGFWGVLR